MTGSPTHRTVETNGIQMHVVEAGDGPLILLLHGFPEGWYSWRHQLSVLADAGFHAVAPDQRGYGRTDRPADIRRYSMFHLVGDVVGLINALGEHDAVVIGHDWGATVAWHTALFRPDLVRGVAALAAPRRPRNTTPPLDAGRKEHGPSYYQVYYQTPGVAEREFEANVDRTMRAFLCGESGQAANVYDMTVTENGMLDKFEVIDPLPPWLTESDIDHWTAEYGRTGFAGGLNWYRNSMTNWELLAPWNEAPILVPAIYIVGDRDVVHHPSQASQQAEALKCDVPLLKRNLVLEGCGHWTQQEKPAAVSRALVEFVTGL